MARAEELATKGLTFLLKNRLEQQGKEAARQEFEEMQKSGHANAIHYRWAMKNLCTVGQRKDESRALMETMIHNGIFPNASDFNELICNLLHDGELVAAQHVYNVDMPAAGIEPNRKTKKQMGRAKEIANTARTFKLKNVLKQQGKIAALQIFEDAEKWQYKLRSFHLGN